MESASNLSPDNERDILIWVKDKLIDLNDNIEPEVELLDYIAILLKNKNSVDQIFAELSELLEAEHARYVHIIIVLF